MTGGAGVLLLNRSEVADLLSFPVCVEAVEEALRAEAAGETLASSVASVAAPGGAFHVKAGGLPSLFAAKINANFPANRERYGLPTIQGVLLLADASTGRPLAVMDSIEITIQRTGAATAVAAKRLARPDARIATICGCGAQGEAQAAALVHALPRLETLFLCDADPGRAERLAGILTAKAPRIRAAARSDLRAAVRESDAAVTCTTSRAPIVFDGDLKPGAFLAAVGADSPDKQEIDPALLASSRVVVDRLDQCAEIGELHHAIAAGRMRLSDVAAELASIVAGRAEGRRSPEESIVFDSTGFALLDAAAGRVVYERAIAAGRGIRWNASA